MAGQSRGSTCKEMVFVMVHVTTEAAGAGITNGTTQEVMQTVAVSESHGAFRPRTGLRRCVSIDDTSDSTSD